MDFRICAVCFCVHSFFVVFQGKWDCVQADTGSAYITSYIAACRAIRRSQWLMLLGRQNELMSAMTPHLPKELSCSIAL